MSQKKLLVMGGSGLIEIPLTQYVKSNHDIHAIIHKDTNPFETTSATKTNLLDDHITILNLIKKLRLDVLVNTAAFASLDLCEANPQLANLLYLYVNYISAFFIMCSRILM